MTSPTVAPPPDPNVPAPDRCIPAPDGIAATQRQVAPALRRIATRWLAHHADGLRRTDRPAVRVGGFVLRPSQCETLAAIRASLETLGGVLVADPPGTGKTVLALAAAGTGATDGGAPPLVIAPAALRAHWERASARAGVPIAFVSHEACSRRAPLPRATLVIVDEAHHLRSTATRRYARVAAACASARTILLSATPVVNRAADRDALLALFLGARASALDPSTLARCVLRTTAGMPRPAVRRLGAIGTGASVPGLAAAIAGLPPPLPIADGGDAGALVRMSLALAWRSSLAALEAALRRRVQRGEAIADLLAAGRTPSRQALRHWTLHDDSTQLAFADLLAGDSRAARATTSGPHGVCASTVLSRHLEAVRALRIRIRPHLQDDADARAAAIRALLAAHPRRRVVVFARHAATIRALARALRPLPGVVHIVGSRASAAAGRWTRDEVLRAFGPAAPRSPTPVARSSSSVREIRVLLTTDVLAEGVEMQDAGIVVHADLPWTPARLEQRLGRATRVGSTQDTVLEAHFAAPRGARALLHLARRLTDKRVARTRALAEATRHRSIGEILSRWAPASADGDGDGGSAVHLSPVGLALALVEAPTGPALVALRRRDGRWRVRRTSRAVLAVLRAIDRAVPAHAPGAGPPTGAAIEARDVRRVQRLVTRTAERLAALALTGASAGHRGTSPTVQHRIASVRARLARIVGAAPALARPALAMQHGAWLARLATPLPVALERRLDALLRADLPDDRLARRLGALLALTPDARPRAGRPAAPPSASPGSAAPR